ncbi:MAG: hypothetical protein NTZ94_02050 [Verrucomicrobia bacterium]|nr:hypothetical protein [Verrucomicrobiota bacterium]
MKPLLRYTKIPDFMKTKTLAAILALAVTASTLTAQQAAPDLPSKKPLHAFSREDQIPPQNQ